jgi:hypothetical protein
LERADGAAFRVAVAEYRDNANTMQCPHELAVAAMLDGALALIEGRYDDAMEHVADTRARARDMNGTNFSIIGSTQAWIAALDRGDAPAEHARLAGRSGESDALGTVAAARALTAAMAGDIDGALVLVDAAAGRGFAEIRFDSEWIGTIGLYADACARCKAVEPASELADVLRGAATATVRIAPIAAWWGPVDHHLGALHRIAGRYDEAITYLQRALDASQRMQATPFAARTAIELARAHAGGEGDPRAATELLVRAETEATRVGATGIAREAAETLAAIG